MNENLFSERLKAEMKRSKLTSDALGKRIGKSGSAIRMYTNGNSAPGIDDLLKIADALQVSTDYLLGHTSQVANVDEMAVASYVGLSLSTVRELHDIQVNHDVRAEPNLLFRFFDEPGFLGRINEELNNLVRLIIEHDNVKISKGERFTKEQIKSDLEDMDVRLRFDGACYRLVQRFIGRVNGFSNNKRTENPTRGNHQK